jgi:uncharacterized membrane protein
MKDVLDTIKDVLGKIIWLFTIVGVLFIGEFLLKLIYPGYDDNIILVICFSIILVVIVVKTYWWLFPDDLDKMMIRKKKIKKLNELRDTGKISEKEYEKKRKKISDRYKWY